MKDTKSLNRLLHLAGLPLMESVGGAGEFDEATALAQQLIDTLQDIIDSNQLEVKKTPKKRDPKPKNATNIVQTISNPAFCILSNIFIKLFNINQCPWTINVNGQSKNFIDKFPVKFNYRIFHGHCP
jgi:hypothetical protein